MYERRSTHPISTRRFFYRLAMHFAVVVLLVAVSLALGIVGYMSLERLAWRDAFLNASMLLGGMGPVDAPKTDGGKIFAGFYALYCGLVFLIALGILAAPLLHRLLHVFHWERDTKG
jgi:hypothetical protein